MLNPQTSYEIEKQIINKKLVWQGWLTINGVEISRGFAPKKKGVKNLVYEAAESNLMNGQLGNILNGESVKVDMQEKVGF